MVTGSKRSEAKEEFKQPLKSVLQLLNEAKPKLTKNIEARKIGLIEVPTSERRLAKRRKGGEVDLRKLTPIRQRISMAEVQSWPKIEVEEQDDNENVPPPKRERTSLVPIASRSPPNKGKARRKRRSAGSLTHKN